VVNYSSGPIRWGESATSGPWAQAGTDGGTNHSSATVAGPFEVFASYDVLERRGGHGPTAQGSVSAAARAATIVRHFDADGFEHRLPQERRSVGSDFPGQKQPASAPGAR
jgi:hypothetical protein